MGRRSQPQIREDLLEASTTWSLDHGLPDRLEPLAAATGASTRMLLYHFETRDALLRAVLERARARQVAFVGDLLRPREDEPYSVTLARTWLAMTGREGRPFLRMFGQLRQDAEQRLWPGFREIATTDWLGPLAEGLRSMGRPELATLVLAVIRGLLTDLEATEDLPRADRAFRQFLHAIDPDAPALDELAGERTG